MGDVGVAGNSCDISIGAGIGERLCASEERSALLVDEKAMGRRGGATKE
jgi:hypothetical protein